MLNKNKGLFVFILALAIQSQCGHKYQKRLSR
jgi:hypothetical protein